MCRKPPRILVTMPESLYLLLTSDSGHSMLGPVNTVIVDEIHAVAGSKRGSHLSLSLARLDALVSIPPRRIGLSATQSPIRLIASFLTGGRACQIVDAGHQCERDLQLQLPKSLFALVRSAWPYRNLKQRDFDQLIDMVAAGYATRRGRRAAFLHHDAINGKLRPRPNARLTALQNGGAIPDHFNYCAGTFF